MESASELLQVEGQVLLLCVLASPGDGAGDNALMGIRVTTRGVGRRDVIAVSWTDLTRITLFDGAKDESISMACS